MVRYLQAGVKAKTECNSWVLLEYLDRSLQYPTEVIIALGLVPAGDVCCYSPKPAFSHPCLLSIVLVFFYRQESCCLLLLSKLCKKQPANKTNKNKKKREREAWEAYKPVTKTEKNTSSYSHLDLICVCFWWYETAEGSIQQ